MAARRSNTNASHHVIVIGGGLAGLTAATLAAQQGLDVLLLEAGPRVGGRAMSETQDEHVFNLGPHALYRRGAGMPILRKMGVRPRGGVPPTKGVFALEGERMHALPASPWSILRSSYLQGRERLELLAIFAGLLTLDPHGARGRSAAEWIDERTRSPRLRKLLRMMVRLTSYANAPEVYAADAALTQLQAAARGNVLYLDGGWQQLVDAVAERLRAAGGSVRVSEPVAGFERDAGRLRALRTRAGERIEAQAFVLAVGPREVEQLLPEFASDTHAAPSARAACLSLALDRLPEPGRVAAFHLDEPLYYSVHSEVAELTPPGTHLVHLARYNPPGESPDAEARLRQLETFLDRLQPGWRGHERHRHYLPDISVVERMPLAAEGGLAGREPGRRDGLSNVALAGDWVGPVGMLADASLASASAAVEHVLARMTRHVRTSSAGSGVAEQRARRLETVSLSGFEASPRTRTRWKGGDAQA